jgi:hypothetical protein
LWTVILDVALALPAFSVDVVAQGTGTTPVCEWSILDHLAYVQEAGSDQIMIEGIQVSCVLDYVHTINTPIRDQAVSGSCGYPNRRILYYWQIAWTKKLALTFTGGAESSSLRSDQRRCSTILHREYETICSDRSTPRVHGV